MFIPEPEYLNILDNIPICCVDIIVTHNNKVLLIRRSEGEPREFEWWIPGGRILKNETWASAVSRKIKTEVGLNIELIHQGKSYEDFIDAKVPSGLHCITTVFLTRLSGDDHIVFDETVDDYQWIDCIDDSLHPLLKQMLQESCVFGEIYA